MSIPSPDAGEISLMDDGPTAAVLDALAHDDPQGVVAVLDAQVHHGRPGSPAALRQQVGDQLVEVLGSQSGRMSRWIDALSGSASPTGRQMACLLLASRYRQDPNGVLNAADALADDAHWEVREAAASLLGTLLDRDFDRVLARLEIRRDRPDRAGVLLDLLEPMLRAQEPYVRRNLGPFAIGDALLRVDPRTTLQRLRGWSRDRDPMVRWNVAMAFSTAIGSFHWPAGKVILERLARGPEPVVRMAVARALRRCRQRYTEDVEETRKRWLRDRERAATAQLVGPPRRK